MIFDKTKHKIELCQLCSGLGAVDGEECEVCAGHGRLLVEATYIETNKGGLMSYTSTVTQHRMSEIEATEKE